MQDLHRIRREPTLDGIEDMSNSKEKVDTERVWAAILKHNPDKSESLRKSTYPGNLKKQKEDIAW